jgi:hypothetical protein
MDCRVNPGNDDLGGERGPNAVAAGYAVSWKISRPISMRRISEVPAPIS